MHTGQQFVRFPSPAGNCSPVDAGDPHFKCHWPTKTKCCVKFLMAFHTIVGGVLSTVGQAFSVGRRRGKIVGFSSRAAAAWPTGPLMKCRHLRPPEHVPGANRRRKSDLDASEFFIFIGTEKYGNSSS